MTRAAIVRGETRADSHRAAAGRRRARRGARCRRPRSRGARGVDRRARHRARRGACTTATCGRSRSRRRIRGCPATELIGSTCARRCRDCGRRATSRDRHRLSPPWTTDWMAPEATAQARGIRHRATAACARKHRRAHRRCRPSASTCAASARCAANVACPRCGSQDLAALAVRLDRVQGAVPLRRLPRAVRLLQAALNGNQALAMSKFHPLSVARVDRETRDAVAITFAVPHALREPVPLQARASTSRCARRSTASTCAARIRSARPCRTTRCASRSSATPGGVFSTWANESLKRRATCST